MMSLPESTSNNSTDQKQSIVLVDDDDIIRLVMQGYLKDIYHVHSFSNAADALTFLSNQNNSVDLILSDINMPETDGLTLRRALNDFEHLEAIPFIFLTGSSENDLRQKARALGIDDFITKPVLKAELLEAIQPTLRRRAQVATALSRMLDEQVTKSLRPSLPSQLRGFDSFMESQEASAGGGDLVLHIPHKDFDYVIIADVMGHGVEAKFFAHAYAGYIYGLMRSFSDTLSPEGFLERLNKAIYDDSLLEKSMLTVCIAQVFSDGRVFVAAAGHPAPLVATKGRVYELNCNGMLLGAVEHTKYEAVYVDLSQGGRLLMFSDGLIELPTMLEEPDKVYQDVAKILAGHENSSMDLLQIELKNYYSNACAEEGLRDDVTYVALSQNRIENKKANIYQECKRLF